MIAAGRRDYPQVEFREGDFLKLPAQDGEFGAAIAFYFIIHLEPAKLALALREVHRVFGRIGSLALRTGRARFLMQCDVAYVLIRYGVSPWRIAKPLVGEAIDQDPASATEGLRCFSTLPRRRCPPDPVHVLQGPRNRRMKHSARARYRPWRCRR
jgi:ubiquinone/menaquinone biosynthesis C-methylase UbiE